MTRWWQLKQEPLEMDGLVEMSLLLGFTLFSGGNVGFRERILER